MSQKNNVEVKIKGRYYNITASEPEEYIYKICSYVDRKMSQVAQMNSRINTDMVAVLAAINICDDMYKANLSEENLRAQILKYDEEADRYEKHIRELEAELADVKAQLKSKEEELTKFIEQF